MGISTRVKAITPQEREYYWANARICLRYDYTVGPKLETFERCYYVLLSPLVVPGEYMTTLHNNHLSIRGSSCNVLAG